MLPVNALSPMFPTSVLLPTSVAETTEFPNIFQCFYVSAAFLLLSWKKTLNIEPSTWKESHKPLKDLRRKREKQNIIFEPFISVVNRKCLVVSYPISARSRKVAKSR